MTKTKVAKGLTAVLTSFLISTTMTHAMTNNTQPADKDKDFSTQILKHATTTAQLLEQSPKEHWQRIPQENLVYMTLANGERVIFELADSFAPSHTKQIRQFAKHHYWDGASVYRVQDNYVAQFGFFDLKTDSITKPLPQGTHETLPAEVSQPVDRLNFTALPDIDPYADATGFADNFPVSIKDGQAFIPHCYGIVGASRANEADSGNSANLYIMIGQPARHLDRQIVVVGRVLQGIEHISTLKRGDGMLGFYTDSADYTGIKQIRTGDMLDASEQVDFEILRTDSPTFAQSLQMRRERAGGWFIAPLSTHIDVCYIAPQIRVVAKT